MSGLEFVRIIEDELSKRGISKAKFYKECGISSATFSQWRKGVYSPSSIAIKKIEKYLGITFKVKSANETAHQFSDTDLMYALFDGEATPEQLEEVKRFAAYVKARDGK